MLKSKSKGFVFTLSAVLVLGFLVLFSQLFVTQAQLQQQGISERILLSKVSFAVDDLQSDFQKILMTKFNSQTSGNYTVISFSDSLFNSKLPQVSNFKAFAENTFASKNNAIVSIDTQGFENSTVLLECSNGLNVDQEYNAESSFFFYSGSESTSAVTLDINLTYNGDLNSFTAWQWQPQGDLQVNFYYKDNAQTLKTSGKIDSSILNTYIIELENAKQLSVSAGLVEGKQKALNISSNASDGIEFTASMQLPFESEPVSCVYTATISYSQLNASITKNFEPARLET